ncbi:MAG: YchF/TatD family DNA exonuclease [Nitrospirae bacterium]|nr:YchF/TatD family DNA exonuclease [Nitrospirota bacterium]
MSDGFSSPALRTPSPPVQSATADGRAGPASGRVEGEGLADSHCHLAMLALGERAAALERAHAAGVGLLILPGTTLADSVEGIALARAGDGLFATVGIHPHEAKDASDNFETQLDQLAGEPKVRAIGEIGLDYHYDHSPRPVQHDVFTRQIAVARRLKLPIVVHIREAFPEAAEILRDASAQDAGGVIHSFTGSYEDARSFLDLGFDISFSGILTFPKAGELREVARKIPIERILVESDSPYLAPVPHRGKPNEPAFVRHTAEVLAGLKGLSAEDVARITTVNTRRAFRLGNGTAVDLAPGDRQWARRIGLEPRLAYRIRDSLYLNITNKCTIACTFCPKFEDYMVKGHFLRLPREPQASEILEAVADLEGTREVVFCGYGEPTLRLDVLRDVARHLKGRGTRVRLNTDGLGCLVHGRNILPELQGLIDCVSVSLNASSGDEYARLCPSHHGAAAYEAVKAFIDEAKNWIPEVQATAVTVPGVDVEACRRIAEEELGVRFRAREFNEVG